MKYGAFPYKVIHFDPIQNLIGKGWANGNTKVFYEIYPKSDKDELPVLFRWTYRVSNDKGGDLFSCIGEGKYLLKFEKGENPDKDLDLLIGTSLINLEIRWEDETRNTPLYGQTIPSSRPEENKKIKEDIIQVAKSEGLL